MVSKYQYPLLKLILITIDFAIGYISDKLSDFQRPFFILTMDIGTLTPYLYVLVKHS